MLSVTTTLALMVCFLTDDLSMKALQGNFRFRAWGALDAGCDVVLHCNGNKEEMLAVAEGLRPITEACDDRLERGWKMARENSKKSILIRLKTASIH